MMLFWGAWNHGMMIMHQKTVSVTVHTVSTYFIIIFSEKKESEFFRKNVAVLYFEVCNLIKMMERMHSVD